MIVDTLWFLWKMCGRLFRISTLTYTMQQFFGFFTAAARHSDLFSAAYDRCKSLHDMPCRIVLWSNRCTPTGLAFRIKIPKNMAQIYQKWRRFRFFCHSIHLEAQSMIWNNSGIIIITADSSVTRQDRVTVQLASQGLFLLRWVRAF